MYVCCTYGIFSFFDLREPRSFSPPRARRRRRRRRERICTRRWFSRVKVYLLTHAQYNPRERFFGGCSFRCRRWGRRRRRRRWWGVCKWECIRRDAWEATGPVFNIRAQVLSFHVNGARRREGGREGVRAVVLGRRAIVGDASPEALWNFENRGEPRGKLLAVAGHSALFLFFFRCRIRMICFTALIYISLLFPNFFFVLIL